MSSYTTIRAGIQTLIETLGLVRCPVSVDEAALMDGRAPGPNGNWFILRPAALGYGGDQGSSVDGQGVFEVLFSWSAGPDPDTRVDEATARAELIRNKLLDDANLSIDARIDAGDPSFTYPNGLILCTIPLVALSYRST